MPDNILIIDINLIDNPGRDVRVGREISEYDDLLISIRESGILQPILVRPREGRYEVIAGNRRLQCARQLGLGEIPALVVVDSVTRLLPGVLGNAESAQKESHSEEGVLEYPQYTKPEVFEEYTVPEVLLSGNHGEIEKWRQAQSRSNSEKHNSDKGSDV